jgi:hypothetical protein
MTAKATLSKAKKAGKDWAHEQLISVSFQDYVAEQVYEAEKNPSAHWLVRNKTQALKAAKNMLQDYRWELGRQLDLSDLTGTAENAGVRFEHAERHEVARAVSEGIRDVLTQKNVEDWLADEILYRSREAAGLE